MTDELFHLAKARAHELRDHRSWHRPVKASRVAADFLSLALQLMRCREGERLDGRQILELFFTPEAVEMLRRLPNLYWFWRVVEGSAAEYGSMHRIDTKKHERVNAECVERACAAHARVIGWSWDLNVPIAELSEDEICARVACAVLLVRARAGRYQVVPNPLLARAR